MHAAHLTSEQRIRVARLEKLETAYDRVTFRAWQAERAGRQEDADRLYRLVDALNARIADLI